MNAIKENTLPVTITDAAAAYIAAQMSHHQGSIGLRLSIKKAGCSGYMYETDIVSSVTPSDLSFQMPQGWTLFVEKKNLSLFQGLQIDCMRQSLGMQQLIFTNPNAKGQCGCGESIMF